MIHRIFEWREDQELGGEGWIMKGQPTFNASRGLGIVHDTLEHFANRYGSITDEMLAFGSILRVRVEGGFFCRQYNPNPAFHLSGDLARMMEKLRFDENIDRAPPTRPLCDGQMEEVIQESITEALRVANYEIDQNEERFVRDETTDRMIA
ncbi:hypothetical protein LP414_27565 [Polaromonas sp. P1(28)-13]|nr:hypothetical protein LP414_27565 [Polaromonas sp. P1(28)-13]